MTILIINIALRPSMPKKIFPIGLSYIASAVHRAGFKFELIDIDAYRYSDKQLEDILRAKDFDIVAFGCIVTGYRIVKSLSSLIKKINRDAVIIAGNSVASSIPELLLSKTDVDIAVLGEGDETIVDLLKCLRGKKDGLYEVKGIAFKDRSGIRRTPPRPVIENIDDIPFPQRDLFPINIYVEESKNYVSRPFPMEKEKIKAMPVNSARGCIYKCTFCYQVFLNNRYRFRSPESVISEIKELKRHYSANYISLWDDLTFFSKKQLSEFVSLLLKEKLDIFWTALCKGNFFTEDDLQLAKEAKKSGCLGFGYSLESANKEILDMMCKKLDKHAFALQKRVLDRAGILSYTSVVLGYPIETEETLGETFDFCYDNDIYPSTGYLVPLPGTPMYDYALKNKYITDEEEYLLDTIGDRQDLRVNLTKIPSDRFQEIVANHLDRINKKLGLGLDRERLIKSQIHQSKLKE